MNTHGLRSPRQGIWPYLLVGCASAAFNAYADPQWTWTGIEIFGNRTIARERILAPVPIKVGDRFSEEGRTELKRRCDQLRDELRLIYVQCGALQLPDGSAYAVIDVVERGDEERIEYARRTRDPKLKLPADLSSLVDELEQEQKQKFFAGIQFSQQISEGEYLDYDDADLHAIVQCLRKAAQPARSLVLRVLLAAEAVDQRARAATLLNWIGNPEGSVSSAAEALSDPAMDVRNNASRFLVEFSGTARSAGEFTQLVQALTKQLTRPTMPDRNKAVTALLTIAQANCPRGRRLVIWATAKY